MTAPVAISNADGSICAVIRFNQRRTLLGRIPEFYLNARAVVSALRRQQHNGHAIQLANLNTSTLLCNECIERGERGKYATMRVTSHKWAVTPDDDVEIKRSFGWDCNEIVLAGNGHTVGYLTSVIRTPDRFNLHCRIVRPDPYAVKVHITWVPKPDDEEVEAGDSDAEVDDSKVSESEDSSDDYAESSASAA